MLRFKAKYLLTLASGILFGIGVGSCGAKHGSALEDDVLVAMGDSVLTVNDVVSRIPIGLESSDSVAMFTLIVDNWIEEMVLTDMARNKLGNIEHIEAMVAKYRNRLIVDEYLKKMRNGKSVNINSDTVKTFFNSHRSEMITEVPLVKGVFVKVPESAPSLSRIRDCVFESTEASIDRLEKNLASEMLMYDYFASDWVDWDIVAEMIPYRFENPDEWLSSNKNFETSFNGSTYFLHIYDHIPSGSEMPYEYAALRITEMLEQAKMDEYEKALVTDLIKKSVADHRLRALRYDPVSGKIASEVN